MRSVLRLVTPPTERAVGLNEARRHMRVEDTDSDDLIAMYLEAAEQSLAYVGRALRPASYALDIYGHVTRCIDLPIPPLRTVTAVKTPDATGAMTAIDPANYSVMKTSEGRGTILTATAYNWPFPLYNPGYVTASVEFTAGYDVVPSGLRAAILLIAGALYDNRSAVAPISLYQMPMGVDALVAPFREQVL
jgi:uncharacterized phiE125 gp8 family phage protein